MAATDDDDAHIAEHWPQLIALEHKLDALNGRSVGAMREDVHAILDARDREMLRTARARGTR